MTAGERAAAAPGPTRPRGQAVVVRLGGAEFGVDVEHVREVLRVPRITHLPFPPPAVLGVVSVRGSLVPVLDLGARLRGAPAQAAGRLLVVTDPASGSEVGLLVDSVASLIPIREEPLAPPPEVEASLPAGWIRGVIAPAPDRLVTLLHLPPILNVTHSADRESP